MMEFIEAYFKQKVAFDALEELEAQQAAAAEQEAEHTTRAPLIQRVFAMLGLSSDWTPVEDKGDLYSSLR